MQRIEMEIPTPLESPAEQRERFQEDELGYLDDCFHRLGPVFSLDLGDFGNNRDQSIPFDGTWVFVANVEDMKRFFKAPKHVLHGGKANVILFGGSSSTTGILRLDEEAHTRRRKLFQPIFTGERLVAYVHEMRRITQRLLSHWQAGMTVNILEEAQKISINIIIDTIFGITEDRFREELCNRLIKVERAEFSRDEILAVERELGAIIHEEIETYRKGRIDPQREDVFALLMRVRDEDGFPLPEKDIHDELLSLLKAGFGTTSNTLSWVCECILSNQDVLELVLEEQREVLGDALVEKEHINGMRYLDAVIKETLRFRPLCGIIGPRLVMEPFELESGVVQPGKMLVNCSYLLHSNPDYFPFPDVFMPERFLSSRDFALLRERRPKRFDMRTWEVLEQRLSQKDASFKWTPFGGGQRMCLGRAFSIQEMKVVVSAVCSLFKIRLKHEHNPPEKQAFFIAPRHGLPVEVVKRIKF